MFSFRKFKKAIDNYSEWTIAYTRSMRNPMLGFTTAINAAFTMIIAFGVFMSRKGTTPELLLNLIFYIIITPVITMTLNKVMYAGENEMLVTDSLNRIDQILQLKPLPVPEQTKESQDNSITLEHCLFLCRKRKACGG